MQCGPLSIVKLLTISSFKFLAEKTHLIKELKACLLKAEAEQKLELVINRDIDVKRHTNFALMCECDPNWDHAARRP